MAERPRTALDTRSRPENDHDTHQYPQSRRDAGQSVVFQAQSRRQCRRPYRSRRRQRPGKSTLLACITGALEPSEGEITKARGLTVGHVAQNVPPALFDTPFYDAVLQALPADQAESESWRVDVVLDSLEVPEAMRGRPLKQLSGGWQRLAMLARTG